MLRKLLLIMLFSLLLVSSVDAQEGLPPLPECRFIPSNSRFEPRSFPGYYILDEVMPRHEVRNRRLLLVIPTTGEIVREVETSFNATHIEWYSWSPDCRYMFAQVDDTGYIWDLVENRRIATIPDAEVLELPHWRPDSDTPTMLLHLRRGNFLWHAGQADPILLTFSGNNSTRRPIAVGFRPQVEWDNEQNRLYFVPYPGVFVIEYDATVGNEIAFYGNGDRTTPVQFTFSNNHTALLVSTAKHGAYGNSGRDGVTVWNLNDGSSVTLDSDFDRVTFSGGIALSPDQRYLVMNGSNRGVLVWDLWNLPEHVEDRDPQVLSRRIDGSLQFINNTVVEIASGNNVRYWDIATGREIEVL